MVYHAPTRAGRTVPPLARSSLTRQDRIRRILGRANAITVMKVVWACEEIGLAHVREDLGGPFGGLEAYLARQPFVAGEAFTLGDIPAGCHVHRYLHMPIDRPDFPALAAYLIRGSAHGPPSPRTSPCR